MAGTGGSSGDGGAAAPTAPTVATGGSFAGNVLLGSPTDDSIRVNAYTETQSGLAWVEYVRSWLPAHEGNGKTQGPVAHQYAIDRGADR